MTKTINLTGTEEAVLGLDGAHAHITNMGADIIYAAKNAGITAGADGVVPIPAGNGNTLRGISGAVYLMGTGSVLVQSDDYVQHPSFRSSTGSGGSAVDEVARAAINKHAGNTELHVTTAEKTTWNGKAEMTDIPTTLPANGGNAYTVNGNDIEMSIYRSASSFGVSSTDTADTIWKAIPLNSIFAIEAQVLTDPSWNFPEGTNQYSLLMIKLSNVRPLGMYLYPKSGGNVFFANVDANGAYAGNWRKLCDGGNAASVGAYTESAIAALEARIAALEGGTT